MPVPFSLMTSNYPLTVPDSLINYAFLKLPMNGVGGVGSPAQVVVGRGGECLIHSLTPLFLTYPLTVSAHRYRSP